LHDKFQECITRMQRERERVETTGGFTDVLSAGGLIKGKREQNEKATDRKLGEYTFFLQLNQREGS